MKLMITWIRKNRNCRSWTNADPYYHSCMAAVIWIEAVKRLAKVWNVEFPEAEKRLMKESKILMEQEDTE